MSSDGLSTGFSTLVAQIQVDDHGRLELHYLLEKLRDYLYRLRSGSVTKAEIDDEIHPGLRQGLRMLDDGFPVELMGEIHYTSAVAAGATGTELAEQLLIWRSMQAAHHGESPNTACMILETICQGKQRG